MAKYNIIFTIGDTDIPLVEEALYYTPHKLYKKNGTYYIHAWGDTASKNIAELINSELASVGIYTSNSETYWEVR